MGYTVGFLELTGHQRYLTDMCRASQAAGHDVWVFGTDTIISELSDPLNTAEISVTSQDDGESLRGFLQRVSGICAEAIDALVVTTISFRLPDLLAYSRFDPPCESVFWPHDIRNWLDASPAIRHGFRDNFRVYLQSRTAANFDHVLVESRHIAQFIKENLTIEQEVYPYLPVIYDGHDGGDSPEPNPVSFVVPGSIHPERRDYDLLLNAFSGVFRSGADVRLVLLGSPSEREGERIIARCESLVDECNADINWYDGWVPESDFQEQMRAADVVLAPLVEKSRIFPIEETYGTTKGSGNVMDAIKYAKPLVLPAFYPPNPEIASSTVTFRDQDDLEAVVSALASGTLLSNLKAQAVDNVKTFSLAQQSIRFHEIISSIVD